MRFCSACTLQPDGLDDGPAFGKGRAGVLPVDGRQVAIKTIPHAIPLLVTIDVRLGRQPVDRTNRSGTHAPDSSSGNMSKGDFPERHATRHR